MTAQDPISELGGRLLELLRLGVVVAARIPKNRPGFLLVMLDRVPQVTQIHDELLRWGWEPNNGAGRWKRVQPLESMVEAVAAARRGEL